MLRRLPRIVACLVAIAHVPCAAQAAPNPNLAQAIDLQPGASCLEKRRLVAHVKMWLGGGAVSPGLHVRVIGHVHDRRRLRFEIERGGQVRQRIFEPGPESCDDAHAVLGLAIALAIDEERLQRDWLSTAPELRPRWLGGLQLSASQSVLPDAAWGAQAGIELGWVPWLGMRLDVLGQYSPEDRISSSQGRFDALLVAGSLQVCTGGWPDARLRLALCTGVAAGLVHAWGIGYAPNTSDTGPWIAIRGGVRFEAQLGLRWLLDIDVISSVSAPGYQAQQANAMALMRAPNATGFTLSLGPAVLF